MDTGSDRWQCTLLLEGDNMAINPVDLRHKEFATSVLGYSKAEVREFLEEVADELERVRQLLEKKADEQNRFQQSIETETRQANVAVQDLQRREDLIARTLLLAEKTKADIMANARKEAENIIREAELKAKKTIQEARQYLNMIEHQYVNMKEQKRQFLLQFRAELQGFMDRISKDPLLSKESEMKTDQEFHAIKENIVQRIEDKNES